MSFSNSPACGRVPMVGRGKQKSLRPRPQGRLGSRFEDIHEFESMTDNPSASRRHIEVQSRLTTQCLIGIKVPKDVSLEPLCIIGCGRSTGSGSWRLMWKGQTGADRWP